MAERTCPDTTCQRATGIGQQQRHRAAVDLADDGVIRQQQRDQRHQEDRQAGQADDGDGRAALTLTAPVGALPRKASVSANAASSSVVATTQRLRSPSRNSFAGDDGDPASWCVPPCRGGL